MSRTSGFRRHAEATQVPVRCIGSRGAVQGRRQGQAPCLSRPLSSTIEKKPKKLQGRQAARWRACASSRMCGARARGAAEQLLLPLGVLLLRMPDRVQRRQLGRAPHVRARGSLELAAAAAAACSHGRPLAAPVPPAGAGLDPSHAAPPRAGRNRAGRGRNRTGRAATAGPLLLVVVAVVVGHQGAPRGVARASRSAFTEGAAAAGPAAGPAPAGTAAGLPSSGGCGATQALEAPEAPPGRRPACTAGAAPAGDAGAPAPSSAAAGAPPSLPMRPPRSGAPGCRRAPAGACGAAARSPRGRARPAPASRGAPPGGTRSLACTPRTSRDGPCSSCLTSFTSLTASSSFSSSAYTLRTLCPARTTTTSSPRAGSAGPRSDESMYERASPATSSPQPCREERPVCQSASSIFTYRVSTTPCCISKNSITPWCFSKRELALLAACVSLRQTVRRSRHVQMQPTAE